MERPQRRIQKLGASQTQLLNAVAGSFSIHPPHLNCFYLIINVSGDIPKYSNNFLL
jgi:hypothetical protein